MQAPTWTSTIDCRQCLLHSHTTVHVMHPQNHCTHPHTSSLACRFGANQMDIHTGLQLQTFGSMGDQQCAYQAYMPTTLKCMPCSKPNAAAILCCCFLQHRDLSMLSTQPLPLQRHAKRKHIQEGRHVGLRTPPHIPQELSGNRLQHATAFPAASGVHPQASSRPHEPNTRPRFWSTATDHPARLHRQRYTKAATPLHARCCRYVAPVEAWPCSFLQRKQASHPTKKPPP